MITTLWYAIWIIQDIMQGFITVNWQVFYREKDKMAGVKNKPWQWNTGIHFSFFFFWDYCCWNIFDYHSSCQPKTRRRAQTSNLSRMFCSEHFYLVGTLDLSATFLLLYQLHEFMFYIFRTLIVEYFGYFYSHPPPPIKKTPPDHKRIHFVQFIIHYWLLVLY